MNSGLKGRIDIRAPFRGVGGCNSLKSLARWVIIVNVADVLRFC